uniref:Transposase Tc1-like domain-containing protein n=1 Tax=Acanthochromis polyacanthus TaxID=80966 RepID=A0A3Q1GJK4_9TELE
MERRGRKRKTTTQPMISSREIKDCLELLVSTGTIRRCLCEASLWARSPRKVPLLNKKDVRKAPIHLYSLLAAMKYWLHIMCKEILVFETSA